MGPAVGSLPLWGTVDCGPVPVGATAMATPFRRWTTCRARKEKTNSTLALAQASEPRVSLLFSPPGPSMV